MDESHPLLRNPHPCAFRIPRILMWQTSWKMNPIPGLARRQLGQKTWQVGVTSSKVPSRELTYPPFKGILEDDVPFPVWWDMLISWRVGFQAHPGRLHMQITHLERNMIWTKPPGNYLPAVNLQGGYPGAVMWGFPSWLEYPPFRDPRVYHVISG